MSWPHLLGDMPDDRATTQRFCHMSVACYKNWNERTDRPWQSVAGDNLRME